MDPIRRRGAFAAAMDECLALAERARRDGDVPVGAVVLDEAGRIIGRGWNVREAAHDPAGHAEIRALREAGVSRGAWRLTGCSLVVTLEPCTMCAGAISLARIATCAYGAIDPKAGAAGSLRDVLRDDRLNHTVEVIPGVRAEECSRQLTDYFRTQREMPPTAPRELDPGRKEPLS
ncbi:MAG: tRNA adenosine(34) deaminase TadA [Flaviflexus sp.]|nr:tRNA adenosine(34) deaminase TadA [Flaviflexus sp.]